jgi:OmpA family
MPDDKQQGSIHSSTEGGVVGKHADPDPVQLLVAPSTSDEFNRARLRLIPTACFRIDDVRFKFDSSFVLPEAKTEMLAFADLRKNDPKVKDAPISVFGHADPSYLGNFELGSSTYQSGDEYNKTLSGRRAIAIYALLVRDPSFWNTLYTNHLGADVWGPDSIQIILDALGQQGSSSFGSSSQGSSSSAANARASDIANDSGQRQQLFLQYMNFLCGDLKLDKSADFLARNAGPDLTGDVQGCSRFNPVLLFSTEDEARYKQAFNSKDETTLRGERDPRNAVNRRVVILVFRKGSQALPSKWPCPSYKEGPDDCKVRFFTGDKTGDARRSTHDSGAERKFEDHHDTFACRFYQRISDGSPCDTIEPPPPAPCKIRSMTVATSPDNRRRTRIAVGEEVDLTVTHGPATWVISSGTGKLSPSSGSHSNVTFVADDVAGKVTITATSPGRKCTITFTVVQPDSWTMQRQPGTNLRHTAGRPDCGWKGIMYVHPNDVNFYRIETREKDSRYVGTGSYKSYNGDFHGNYPAPDHASDWFTITRHSDSDGSTDDTPDTIYTGLPGTAITGTAPPFNVGSGYFPITMQWRVLGSPNIHDFPVVRQEDEIFDSGRCESRKGGNTEHTIYDWPDSTY